MGVLEGIDNTVEVSGGTLSNSAGRPAAIPESVSSRWVSALCEVKQRIEQLAEGRFERTSLLDQVPVLSHSPEEVSYALLSRTSHLIVFSCAAVVCASLCPAPPSLLPTSHLLSGF